MSAAKFAAITSDLLARKGEARPWGEALRNETAEKPPLSWRAEKALPPAAAWPRSCAVRMSQQDYERLGIIAVKTGSSRQQLLKDALAEFLDRKAQALPCACLGGGTSCENC